MFVIAHNGSNVWGGAERATALLLAGLAERGHRVLLLCGSERVAAEAGKLGVPTARHAMGGDLAILSGLLLAARLRRLRPDVFIIGTYRKIWLAALGARLARVPRVVARIGLETDTPKSWKYRAVLGRWVDVVVANAPRVRPAFLALPGWTEDRVVTIYLGTRIRRTPGSDVALRERLGLAPGTKLIGVVARHAPQKRMDRLLQVMTLLPDDVHCVVAGDGPLRPEAEALASRLAVSQRVHFLGHVEDVLEVLRAVELVVITSDREGLSNAMVEALAMGVPVVSTPVSGAEESLAPLPDGRRPGIVTSFEPEEIAAEVARLLADPGALREMGEAAVERARERFGWERYIDAWEEVLRGGPGRGREGER